MDLPISWLGQIGLIKMNILPRLLYPLQRTLLYIGKNMNCDLEKHFSRFIWHKKKPRLKISKLQLPIMLVFLPSLIFISIFLCLNPSKLVSGHALNYAYWFILFTLPYSPFSLLTGALSKIILSRPMKRNVWKKDFGNIPENKEWEKALGTYG